MTRKGTVPARPCARGGAAGGRRAGTVPLGRAMVIVALCLVLSLGHGIGGAARAQAADADTPVGYSEYLIKAAILYNFAKFAKWPPEVFSRPDAALRVCVLGEDPFGAALESIEGKRIRHRSLVTTRIGQAEQAERCHVLFISASEEGRLRAILDDLHDGPVPTISTMPGAVLLTEMDAA